MEKLELEKVKVSEDMVRDVSELVSNTIEEREFVEGVFYFAEGGIDSELQLSIIYLYNDMLSKFKFLMPLQSHQELVKLTEEKYGILIREEEYYYRKFQNTGGLYCYDSPIEAMLGVGEIIYDSKGHLNELKDDIMKDDSVDASRMRTCCQIEPPITYIKKKS